MAKKVDFLIFMCADFKILREFLFCLLEENSNQNLEGIFDSLMNGLIHSVSIKK